VIVVVVTDSMIQDIDTRKSEEDMKGAAVIITQTVMNAQQVYSRRRERRDNDVHLLFL